MALESRAFPLICRSLRRSALSKLCVFGSYESNNHLDTGWMLKFLDSFLMAGSSIREESVVQVVGHEIYDLANRVLLT